MSAFFRIGYTFVHGAQITFLLTSPTYVGVVQNVNLQWNYVTYLLNPFTICIPFLCSTNLYVNNVAITTMNVYSPQ